MLTPEPVDIVARTLWAEARSHGMDGMAAVANVIANRVAQPGWWGKDWVGVCKAKWQFSCWNPQEAAKNRILTVNRADPDFNDALAIAAAAIAGELRDRTGGADHYYAEYISEPDWAKGRKATAIIGPLRQRHFFYRIGLAG